MALNPLTNCPMDHAAINAALLIGNGGLEWRACPYCGVMVEAAMRLGNVIGPYWGPGRGELTVRQQARLTAWAGWADWNGPR